MKRICLTTIAVLLSTVFVLAQSPDLFGYQGVARDNAGNVLANQGVSLRLTVRSGSSVGAIEYRETHGISTNQFGLMNVQLGNGTPSLGNLTTVDWGGNSHFLQVEMDPAGGSSYTDMGTAQLVSVAYAKHAETSGSGTVAGALNYVGKFTPDGATVGNSQIIDNGTGISVNYSDPIGRAIIDHPSVDADDAAVLDQYNLILSNSSETTGPEHGLAFRNSSLLDNTTTAGAAITFERTAGQSAGNLYFKTKEGGGMADPTLKRMTVTSNGNVGIGTLAPTGKLHVASDLGNYTGQFTNTLASGSVHVIHAESNHIGGTDVVGVWGENTVTPWYGYGMRAFGGWYGIRAEATETGTNSRYGVFGVAGGSSNTCYGIYGSANGSGINYAGYFAGDVYSTGAYLPSDEMLKSGVSIFKGALSVIRNIPVKSYEYKKDGIFGKMGLPIGNQIGIMAQDLEEVYPQLVKHAFFEDVESYEQGLVDKENMESIDYKAVNYTGLIPVLVQAIKEQQELIEQMRAELDELK